ncbi:Derlin [Psidium guajava]|nr:Derlin [Psidium guajava]
MAAAVGERRRQRRAQEATKNEPCSAKAATTRHELGVADQRREKEWVSGLGGFGQRRARVRVKRSSRATDLEVGDGGELERRRDGDEGGGG